MATIILCRKEKEEQVYYGEIHYQPRYRRIHRSFEFVTPEALSVIIAKPLLLYDDATYFGSLHDLISVILKSAEVNHLWPPLRVGRFYSKFETSLSMALITVCITLCTQVCGGAVWGLFCIWRQWSLMKQLFLLHVIYIFHLKLIKSCVYCLMWIDLTLTNV